MVNQSTLNKLSSELSKHRIKWGIGGSYLLQLYDLYSDPDDLDLWVQPCDMSKVKEIFKDFSKIETNIPLPEEFHYKIKYFDIDVDFVACFIIKPNQKKFIYNISPENIRMVTLKNGYQIPCTYLEDWYVVYKLLKRKEKADLIENGFREKRIPFSEKSLRASIENSENIIPRNITKEINYLIRSTFQLSLWDYEAALEFGA